MAKRRPSGDGMVRKKENGRWEGRIVIGHKKNGDSIFRYVYGNTQKEMSERLRQEIQIYEDVDLTEDMEMTLGEWLDRWLSRTMAQADRPSTLSGYQMYADLYIKPILGDKQIAKVIKTDIQKMYLQLKEQGRIRNHPKYGHQLSDSMINSIHSMLHGALKAAEECRIIPRNPTEGVKVTKSNNKVKQVLTRRQMDTFLNVIRGDEIWHDFFYVELTTGLRRGEICGLRWTDFDEAAGTLQVSRTIRRGLTAGDTKTYAGTRKILLPPSSAELLQKRKVGALTEWIFPNPLYPERPTNPESAYHRMKKLLEIAELPSIRFHDLRHTFATLSLKNGVDVKTLSGALGHYSAGFTLNVYTHATPQMKREAADTIGNAINQEM